MLGQAPGFTYAQHVNFGGLLPNVRPQYWNIRKRLIDRFLSYQTL